MLDINKVPKELLEKREIIECNFIFTCYKDPLLLSEYSAVENGEDIITNDGTLYYGILKNMIKQGFQEVTNMSMYDYLESKPTLKQMFEERGGWNTVKEITDLLSESNIAVYYEELVKSNLLIRLHFKNFGVLKELTKLKEMTSEEIYSYYEYQLADINVTKINKLVSEDLTSGYEEYIDEWDKGTSVGYPISSKMLNHQLLGLHKKNMLLHLAGIGQGKTTSAIHWYILPSIEIGEDVTICANEQGVNEWRQMILATVLFSKVGTVQGFSRHKMMIGHYSNEQKNKMIEAAKWLEKQPGKINFIETNDYAIDNMKKIMAKYNALGSNIFIVDTLKPEDDSSDKAWGAFSEVAKALFLEAKNRDICLICTAQISPEAMSRRYLDLTCIAKAKSIAETATQVVMFRPLTTDEKKKLKGYSWEGKVKKIINLDENKDYIMVFTPKNRFGQVSPQILMERNMNFNTYKDIGWINCEYDQFRTR